MPQNELFIPTPRFLDKFVILIQDSYLLDLIANFLKAQIF